MTDQSLICIDIRDVLPREVRIHELTPPKKAFHPVHLTVSDAVQEAFKVSAVEIGEREFHATLVSPGAYRLQPKDYDNVDDVVIGPGVSARIMVENRTNEKRRFIGILTGRAL